MPLLKYDEIEKWWNAIVNLKVHQHVACIMKFYFHPSVFWKRYDKLSSRDKAIQFGTYATLFVIILLCCGVIEDVYEGIKVLLMELLRLSVYWVSIILALIVATRSFQKKVVEKGVIFGIYLYLLFIPIQVIFLLIFKNSEAYLFYALALLVSIVIDVYIIVVPCMAFLTRKRDKWIYVLAWMALISLADFFYIKYEIKDSDLLNRDVIAQERYDRGKNIQTGYKIPAAVVSTPDGAHTRYLYQTPIDTIATLIENDAEYFRQLEADVDTLANIIPSMEYRMNQDFYDYAYNLKKHILYVYKNCTYRRNPVIKRRDTEYGVVEYRVFSDECAEMNYKLLSMETKYHEKFERVKSVNYMRLLYRPYILWTYIDSRYLNERE